MRVSKKLDSSHPAMAAEVGTSQAVKRQKVLDEDEWTECLETIIQRDYFPNVPRLQNKLEWLEVRDTFPPAAFLAW